MAEKVKKEKKEKKEKKVIEKLSETQKIRKLDNEEIEQEIVELKKELFKLRFDAGTGKLEKPHRLNQVKKRIARLKTILTEREMGVR